MTMLCKPEKEVESSNTITRKTVAGKLKTNHRHTIHQVHRIKNITEKVLEEEIICMALFLDVKQAFNNV